MKANLKGVGVAVAVKMLHPKRPGLVPVIDGQNFFGSYQHPEWQPGMPAFEGWTARSHADLVAGLKEIRRVVGSPENIQAWDELDGWVAADGRGPFERVALFDMLWWALRFSANDVLTGAAP